MSADNYIGIWKCKDGKYRGYYLSASYETPKKRPQWKPYFVANTVTDAILSAQKEYTEYGFRFMNIKGG